MEFITSFPFVIHYKQEKENIVVDTLSQKYTLISTLSKKLLGFKHMKELYMYDVDFAYVYKACEHVTFREFYGRQDFLLRKVSYGCLIIYCMNCLCVKLTVLD